MVLQVLHTYEKFYEQNRNNIRNIISKKTVDCITLSHGVIMILFFVNEMPIRCVQQLLRQR